MALNNIVKGEIPTILKIPKLYIKFVIKIDLMSLKQIKLFYYNAIYFSNYQSNSQLMLTNKKLLEDKHALHAKTETNLRYGFMISMLWGYINAVFCYG